MIRVRAKGNPDDIKYKWNRNNTQLKSLPKKLSVEGSELNFTEVSRKDRGKYEVEATNTEGTTKLEIELDVQCKLTNSHTLPLLSLLSLLVKLIN